MNIAQAVSKRPDFRIFDLEDDFVNCDWTVISGQLLNQWPKLTPMELERTRHNRHEIALLIQKKYGIHAILTENYLKNLERTLPLLN